MRAWSGEKITFFASERAAYVCSVVSSRQVAALRKALGVGRSDALIVSHNPPSDEETFWLDVGGIKGHHMVYSAHEDSLAVFTRIGGELVPLEFRGAQACRIDTLFNPLIPAEQLLVVRLRPDPGSLREGFAVWSQRIRAAWVRATKSDT